MSRKTVIGLTAVLCLIIASQAPAFSFNKSKVVFTKGPDTWVKITRSNKKLGQLEHPGRFTWQDIRKALDSMYYFRPNTLSLTDQKGKEFELLTEEELDIISPPLAEAIAMLKPDQKVGIITIHNESLSQKHLAAVGADAVPHVIVGTEGEEEFSRAILEDKLTLNVDKSKEELIKVAEEMIFNYPDVGAIVLECTNMTPYAADIQEEIGLPVFDIYTLVNMVYQAVVRKRFTGIM